MRIRYAAKTDVGMKRTHNEDYFSLVEQDQLFLVADGMGGHASGEVASKMAADTIQEFFARSQDDDITWPYKMDRQLSFVENRLVVGVKMANQRIHEAANKDLRLKGMGTTVDDLVTRTFTERRPASLLQRYAQPEEIANLICYVCSKASSATNGAALRADGGIVTNPF